MIKGNKLLILMTLMVVMMASTVLAAPIDFATDDFECAGFNCGTGWLSGWQSTGTCNIVTANNPLGVYHLEGGNSCDIEKTFDASSYTTLQVSFYATAQSLENPDHCYYYYYDGAAYHQLLDLGNGDDDATHDLYTFDVSSYGTSANSGIRMFADVANGDRCYIDNVVITGDAPVSVNLFLDQSYQGGSSPFIDMTSNLPDTQHTLELYQSDGTLFCNEVRTSPSTPLTLFSAQCNMPSIDDTNAYAILYPTSMPGEAITEYFNITQPIQDPNAIKITQAYFSPQVLQGGSTEVFVLLDVGAGNTVDSAVVTLTFPDGTSRDFTMEQTGNEFEYRAFITDTFQTGTVSFSVRVESGIAFDTYGSSYEVAPYNVDFVDIVNQVGEVLQVKKQTPSIDVLGTYYEVGDDAKVIAQVSEQGNPINNAFCFASIYSPDNSIYLRNTLMHYVENSDGLYVYDMPIPLPEDKPGVVGVWPISVACDYDSSSVNYKVMNAIYNEGVSIPGSPTALWFDDGVYSHLQTSEINSTTDRIDVELEYYNITDPAGSQSLRLFVDWEGYTTTNSEATLYFWDYDNSQWVDSENAFGGAMTQVSYEAPKLTNESVDKYVSSNGTAKIRILGDSYPNEETINIINEGFEGPAQSLPETGSFGNVSFTEKVDDIDLDITTTNPLSGTSSMLITGNPIGIEHISDMSYLNTYGTIKFNNFGVFEKFEDGGDAVATNKLDHSVSKEERRGFLRFDVPTHTGANIESAALTIVYHAAKGKDSDAKSCYADFYNISDWYPLDSSDWTDTGALMFTQDGAEGTLPIHDPQEYDVTDYVSSGNVFSLMMKTRWKSATPPSDAECKIVVDADTRTYLEVKYDDGSVELLLPVDTTNFWDISAFWTEEVSDAIGSDKFNYSVSSDGGVSWETIYNFGGNHIFDSDVISLSSAYDNNPNVILKVSADISSDATKFKLDNIGFSGTHRIPHDIFTDYIWLTSIDASGVVDSIRGGGEFNVKDRWRGITSNLTDINVNIGNLVTNKYGGTIISPDVMSPYDITPLVINVYKMSNPSEGVSGATCTLNAKGPSVLGGSGSLVLSGYPMSDEGAGTYYASPPAPSGGWPSGVYLLEVNCQKSGYNVYITKNIRIEDKIYQRIWEYNDRTLTQDAYDSIADEIWTVNRTIEPGLSDQMSTSIWNYVARYVHGEILN